MPDPRDPITGKFLPTGPIVLAEHQKRIVNEALSRNEDGNLKYSTVIYSAPKKSGKSAIASAVTLYFAYHNAESHIYCLANDKKQSEDRIYEPIYNNFRHHRSLGGIFKDVKPYSTEVTLDNHTRIEAVPCDAAGEAGSQPTFVVISEVWGWDTENKKKLFSEMTIPPTLEGRAMRWIESYAGFSGKSEILENLYYLGTKESEPHPDFLDLVDENGDPVVFVNEAAKMFCYWDTVPRMIWQTDSYYVQEAQILSRSEFKRIHRNQWSTAVESFIEPEWWNALSKEMPELGPSIPLVLGVDAAISNDSAAIVGTTRDSDDNEHVAVRFAYIFTPEQGGGVIRISDTVEKKLRELIEMYNVICIAYDPYQLEDMAQRMRKERLAWMYNFSQGKERAIADKNLYDRILNKTIWWNRSGNSLAEQGISPSLYAHITKAGAQKEGSKLRLEKLSNKLKIDAAVALSMSSDKCMNLNITNQENSSRDLLRDFELGRITEKEFMETLRKRVEHAR